MISAKEITLEKRVFTKSREESIKVYYFLIHSRSFEAYDDIFDSVATFRCYKIPIFL